MPSLTPDALVNRAARLVRQHASQRDQDLLLAVLQYAPSERGRTNVANKILCCGAAYKGPHKEDSCHFAQLADFFWRNIIVPGACFSLLRVPCLDSDFSQCACLEERHHNPEAGCHTAVPPPRMPSGRLRARKQSMRLKT